MASGWDIFGIPKPDPGGLESGFFYFGLDRKIGIGIRKSRKSQHPGIEIGILKPLKNLSRKTRNPGDEDWDFYPRDLGFFLISGFLSPRFSQNSRDSGFFTFGIGVFSLDRTFRHKAISALDLKNRKHNMRNRKFVVFLTLMG